MAKIKRSSGKGVRRAARSQSRSASARRAKAKTTGVMDKAMGVLPFTEDQWSKIWLTAIIVGGAALTLFIANLAGVPALAQAELSRAAQNAGFEIKGVRVSGTERMDAAQIEARVLAKRDRPMPEVDIEEMREELLAFPWVKDARVSIQLPHTIAVSVIERTPHAVLEKPDRLVLIDAEGVELEPISRENASEMLRISGPGAAQQVAPLEQLLASAPALSPQIEAAEWVGNRRWNLTFATDQVLALPEGADASSNALIKFARMDGQNRLLGGEVATFDMRSPPRVYLRVPGRADAVELADNSTTGN